MVLSICRGSGRAPEPSPFPVDAAELLMPLSMSQSICSDTPWPACLPHCTLQITAMQRVTRGDLSYPKSGLPEPSRSPLSGTVSREVLGRAEEAERKQPPPPKTNTWKEKNKKKASFKIQSHGEFHKKSEGRRCVRSRMAIANTLHYWLMYFRIILREKKWLGPVDLIFDVVLCVKLVIRRE